MKFKYILMFAALFAMLGLASCSNDDFGSKSSAPKGNPVEVSVKATINHGNDSRAEMLETADGSIKSRWNAGDRIFAYNPADQSYVGYLSASEPDADGFATFTGTLYLYDSCNLTFYYLGSDPSRDFNEFWIDLTHQTNSIAELGEYAVMVDAEVPFVYNPKGVSRLDRNLSFNLIISYAHFNISLPEGVEYNCEDIVLRGKNLKNGAALLLLKNELDIPAWEEDETITINGLGDLYFAFIPGSDIELHFSTEIDGVAYYYNYPRPMTFKPAVYYRRSNPDGTTSGVPITLAPDYRFVLEFGAGVDPLGKIDTSDAQGIPAAIEAVDHTATYTFTIPEEKPTLAGRGFVGYREAGAGADGHIYAPGDQLTVNFADPESDSFAKEKASCTKRLECVWKARVYDHSLNPLSKWAETNLDLRTASGFADDCTKYGQYFQFGRNVPFNDLADARSRYSIYTSAADGSYNSGLTVYSGDQAGTLATANSYHPGSGTPAERFLINHADLKGGNSNDWWSERANMGDTWAKRATAEGWPTAEPCPAGWRLPTARELAEIMPAQTDIAVTGIVGKDRGNYLIEFNKILTANIEVRDNDECRYAVCWHFVYHPVYTKTIVFRVAALVVDPNFEGTLTASEIWKDPNAVIRYFPIGGEIKAYMHAFPLYLNSEGRVLFSNTDATYLTTRHLATPIPYGVYEINIMYPYSPANFWLYGADKCDYTSQHCGYWTSDGAAMEMTYDWHLGDTKLVLTEPFALRTIADENRMCGLFIRCVRK